MAGVASVHIADLGVRRGIAAMRAAPADGAIAGLRHANVGSAAPLSGALLPRPGLSRVVLVGFWDDDAAIDRFEATHPLADQPRDGWSARLEPLRRFGSWPGLDPELSDSRHTDHDGPAVVLTLGRLRVSQAPRFLKTSAKAEASVVEAPGVLWATGFARPPFLATCSIWDSARSLSTYAYGAKDGRHPHAIDTDAAKPFHHQSAFVRFRPYRVDGALRGKNPLPPHTLTAG